ncbi:MAG: S41 family peptidase [Ramlibacter sp.]|nr:S41 family peptidase [Ramlibacter sp.]
MKWLYVAGLCLLIQACGGGGDPVAVPEPPPAEEPQAPQACSLSDQRDSLRAFMNEQYYWYPYLAPPEEGAQTMDAYFRSMLYKASDRYSYTQPASAYTQVFTEGRRIGYGYALAWADDLHTALRVRNVEPLSPIARAGIVRGDTVLSMDGVGPEGIVGGQLRAVTTEGVPRSITYRDAAGETRSVTVVSEDFALTPVPVKRVLDVTRDGAPVKVGYLAYHQFVGYSRADLGLAFTEFAAAGITELVLDLRYNGGGSVLVSRDLASMIGGSRTANQLFAYLRFNDKQVANNIRVGFNGAETPLGMPLPQGLARVVVITSPGTASASELVINGLKPFIDVVLVGGTTYGKPFGFIPRNYCGTTYSAVQFGALNSAGYGAYTSGFTPDCAVPDDLDRPLGDPSERRLKVALDYVATGRCSVAEAPLSAPLGGAHTERAFGETVPSQMFLD